MKKEGQKKKDIWSQYECLLCKCFCYVRLSAMARARLSMCEPASNRKGKLMKRSLGIYSYCNTARKLRSERAFKVLFMSQAGCAQSFPSRVLSALAWTDTVSSPGMTTGPGVWLRLCLWGHDHHGLQVGSQLMFPFPPSCNRQTLSHSPCIQTAASLSLSHTHTHTHVWPWGVHGIARYYWMLL